MTCYFYPKFGSLGFMSGNHSATSLGKKRIYVKYIVNCCMQKFNTHLFYRMLLRHLSSVQRFRVVMVDKNMTLSKYDKYENSGYHQEEPNGKSNVETTHKAMHNGADLQCK